MVFVFWWSSLNMYVYIYLTYIRIVVADNKNIELTT